MHSPEGATPHMVAVWTLLNRAATAARDGIEAALSSAGLPPLAWYDVLWEIEKAGAGGVRPFEVQDRLLLPQYGLSRLIARLEAAGLVIRAPSPADGRGQVVTLTDEGRRLRAAMWPVYSAALARHIGARLSADEAERLAALLAGLLP